MTRLKARIALMCTLGVYALGTGIYGPAAHAGQNNAAHVSQDDDNGFTALILSFFAKTDEDKDVGPEVILLEKPPKENAGAYITLTEPEDDQAATTDKSFSVTRSYDVRPALVFNMGNSRSSFSGLSGLNRQTTGSQVTFSYGDSNLFNDPKALDISIGSQFLVEQASILSALDESGFGQVNQRRAYNLSLDVGYAGFSLGASFSRENMLFESGLTGFDVGFGYSGSAWGADVKFGEYKRERDLLFSSTEDYYETIYALEIGAAYQIRPNIRFTGRFSYYAYGQASALDEMRNSQVFFLGTNVNF